MRDTQHILRQLKQDQSNYQEKFAQNDKVDNSVHAVDKLPQDILFEIAKYLKLQDICALAMASKILAKHLLFLYEDNIPKLIPNHSYKNNTLYLFLSNRLFLLYFNNKNASTQLTPITIPGFSGKILQVIAEDSHTFILTSEGLFGCGRNNYGQIGLGHKNEITQFTPIPGFSGKTSQVIAEDSHTFILTTERLFACGKNNYGQLGLGHKNEATQFTPITIPSFTGKILQVTAKDSHTFVLTTEGLFACGINNQGQLGLGHKNETTQFTSITIPSFTGKILQVIAEYSHTFILTSEGLFACGRNNYGQLGLGHKNETTQFTPITIPSFTGKILQVIAEYSHTFILTSEGLFGCGRNNYGQLSLWHKDESTQFTPITIPGFTGKILQVIAEYSHTFILTTEGLFGCGLDIYGQLGLSHKDKFTQFTPITIPDLTGEILQIIAKDSCTFVLTTEGLFGCGKYSSRLLHFSDIDIIVPYFTAIKDSKMLEFLLSIYPKLSSQLSAIAQGKLLTSDTKSDEKHKEYLVTCKSHTFIEKQKQVALNSLEQDIKHAINFKAIYKIFTHIIQSKTSVLRLHRENLFNQYGDTTSYQKAIKLLVDKSSIFLIPFAQYQQLSEILQEAKRCHALMQNWKATMIHFKTQAFNQFMTELNYQTKLTGILELFDCINIQKPLGQANILRFEAKNILSTYGHTDTYKAALFSLANYASREDYPVSHDENIKCHQLLALKQLRENLQAVKPYFNQVWQARINPSPHYRLAVMSYNPLWQKLIDALEQKIQLASTNNNSTNEFNFKNNY